MTPNLNNYGVLIPAYNEEKTIAAIIKTALKTGFTTVLVVSDGSNDNTETIAKQAGAHTLTLEKNQGKGAAVLAGAKQLKTQNLILLDADLIRLEPYHILALIDPVESGRVDTTAGLFSGGGVFTDFGNRASPKLSGQRCIPRTTILNTPHLETRGYGIELAINDQIQAENLRLEYVDLPGVAQVMKEQKRGFCVGFFVRLRMYWEIFVYALFGRGRA